MWRTYVICVLIGLLLVTTGSDVWLLRQTLVQQADSDRLRARLSAAESNANALQQQIDQLKLASPSPTPAAAPLPTVVVAPSDRALLQQIQRDVAFLRGLQPKQDVAFQFLDQAALQRYFTDRFERDYLPSEREADQKLLVILGLIDKNESVAQTLLGVLLEQVIGVYNEDDKVMYIVADRGQFGPEEKTTVAHEFTHALQDQYFDLRKLSPKHPANDDQALAALALTEGDAVLMQRLWTQEKLTHAEITQLPNGSSASRLFSAPLFIREQLLFPYSDGFNFVRQTFQTRGGYLGVDEIFRNPPESTKQILHPEAYRAHVKPVDVTVVDLSQGSLGPGWRQIKSNVFGELDLRLILEQLTDRPRAVRSAAGWAGDRFALLEKDGRQALAIKTVWDSENEARTFFDAFSLGMKNRFPGSTEEERTSRRQALTAPGGATEVLRSGTTVVAVIAFDRPTAEAIAATIGV